MENQPPEKYVLFTFLTFVILYMVAHKHDIFVRVVQAPDRFKERETQI